MGVHKHFVVSYLKCLILGQKFLPLIGDIVCFIILISKVLI